MLLIPALGRQVNLCEFEISLIYRVSSRTGSKATHRNPVSKNQKRKEESWRNGSALTACTVPAKNLSSAPVPMLGSSSTSLTLAQGDTSGPQGHMCTHIHIKLKTNLIKKKSNFNILSISNINKHPLFHFILRSEKRASMEAQRGKCSLPTSMRN